MSDMDLNHIACELDAKLYGDRGMFVPRILAALESVQSETERRTLERAAQVIENGQERFSTGPDGENNRDLSPRSNRNIAGLAYAEAIRALMETPVPPDPLFVALAGFFRAVTYFEGVGLAHHVLDTCRATGLTYGNGAPTELGKSAIALADGR